jgi:hypothetical protein
LNAITLRCGGVILVDEEDVDYVNSYPFRLDKAGYARYTKYMGGGRANSRSTKISLHRVLTNCPDDMQVDHIDGNVLNCTKANLRVCSEQQNQSNKTGSGWWVERLQKFQVQIRHQGVRHYVGLFDTQEEAEVAYDLKAKELRNEFARSN